MKVIIKQVERVFDYFFKIDKAVLQYEQFDGTLSPERVRLNFNRGHSVAILIYNQTSDTVVLTRQFRYPAYVGDPGQGWILEIVAGMLESEASPFEMATKEIFEETGYQATHLEPIYHFFVSPGGTSEKIYLFFTIVTDNDRRGKGGGVATEGEDIQVEHIKLERTFEMLQTGAICDAKTIIALQWLKQNLARLPGRQQDLQDKKV